MALWLARFCRRSLPPTLKAGRKRRAATRANAAPARSRTPHTPCAPLSLPKHSAFPRLFHPRRPFRRNRSPAPFLPSPPPSPPRRRERQGCFDAALLPLLKVEEVGREGGRGGIAAGARGFFRPDRWAGGRERERGSLFLY